MKNYLSYPLSLTLFILYGCSQDPNLVTINGIIGNQVNDTVMLNFPDTSYQATLNSNGRFKIMFSQDSAQYATLIHGEMARLFLKPGDKVTVKFDTDEFDETMSYENSPESSFLADKVITTEKGDFYGETLYLSDESEYKKSLDDYKNTLLKKLEIIEDGYFKRTEVERLETSINRYIKQKESFSERSPVELRYMWDARVLSQEYNFYGLIESTTKSEYSQKLSEYEKRMLESVEQLKNIEGYGIEKEKIIAVASKWRERKNDYDNMPNDGDMSIDFSYPNQSDEIISLSSFRGSIVYVDVWATWCGPCIAEIPSLEKLQKDYEDKDIVFLSVSVDTDKEAWDKMLVEDHLGGVQLWADGWSEITKSYAIFGIPRFILVDKAGTLISVDAPRPSSNEIRSLIEENI